MLLVIPFLISFLLVAVSSYLLASVFEPKKYGIGFLYTLIIAYAQVVFTFEVLSLFSKINVAAVVIANIIIFFAILTFWDKKGRPLYCPQIKKTLARIIKALKRDKFLMTLAIGFLFLIGLITCIDLIMPVNSYDALCYHLNRAAFWVSQGNLNHFDIADDRNLVMPINSEIMYSWVLLFLKNDWALGIFSFLGYIASLFSLYNILSFFKFSERKKLWSIFILSSFASLIAEASSIETDVIIGGLIISAILLYLNAIKDKKTSLIFFASLAYALAIGTKTPSIIAFPGFFMLISYYSFKNLGKEAFKPLSAFLIFLFFNFLIFGSYNYFLNWIDFGNPMSTESSIVIHKFWGGPKAFIANYIRYIFMLFDFSGFRYSEYFGAHILHAKSALLHLLHIPENLGVTMSDKNIINNSLLDVKMGAGILGFLLFLPCTIVAIFLALLNRTKKKIQNIMPFGIMFFINIAFLSGMLGYMVFSIRFVSFFIILSSPVLVYSYFKKNPLVKTFILFFALSYMFIISTHLAARSVKEITRIYKKQPNIVEARELIRCSLYRGFDGKMSFCHLKNKILEMPAGTKIGIFSNYTDRVYPVKMLFTMGYEIDTLLIEKIEIYNLDKYDYLIFTNPTQTSSLVRMPERAFTDYTIEGKNFKFFNKPTSRCIYLGPQGFPVWKGDKKPITYSVCRVYDEYLKKIGFEFAGAVNYQSVLKENQNVMYFYKNYKKLN